MPLTVFFLDFDGVLNRQRKGFGFLRLDPAPCMLLDKLCKKHDAKIVVSSTWRMWHSIEQLQYLLGERGLTAPVIDKTGDWSPSRGDEIKTWLDSTYYDINKIVIFDDDPNTWPLNQYHVMTDKRQGLKELHIKQAEGILRWQKWERNSA